MKTWPFAQPIFLVILSLPAQDAVYLIFYQCIAQLLHFRSLRLASTHSLHHPFQPVYLLPKSSLCIAFIFTRTSALSFGLFNSCCNKASFCISFLFGIIVAGSSYRRWIKALVVFAAISHTLQIHWYPDGQRYLFRYCNNMDRIACIRHVLPDLYLLCRKARVYRPCHRLSMKLASGLD